jgi:uncharacterized protein
VLKEIYKLHKSVKDIKYFILCGDITGDFDCTSFSELENKQYSNFLEIKGCLREISHIKTLFILGNHDVLKISNDEEMYTPNNCKKDQVNFVPLEYLNFIMYGTRREGDEEDMKYRLQKLNVSEKSIIVAHQPPYKCLDKANNGKHYGSQSIREMIRLKRPALYLCGHVHEGFGVKKLYDTLVVNAACDTSNARGWIIDIETVDHKKVEIY